MSETLHLSLKRKTIPVVLEDENGTAKNYTLKELSGAERNTYLNKMTSRVELKKDGHSIRMKSFDGFQADLLTVSLYEDDSGDAVTKDFVESLPSSAQQELFDKAQKLSDLGAKSGDLEKND